MPAWFAGGVCAKWEGMGKGGAIREWIQDHAASVLFYLYVFFLAPPLARSLKAGLARPEALWGPGFLLLAVWLLEPVGLRWKVRFLRRRNQDEGFAPQGSMLILFSLAVIGHMIVTVVVGLVLLDSWGVPSDSPWIAAGALLGVLKDFTAFFLCAGKSVSREAPGHWKERTADVILLAFSCVAYTVWWESLLDLGEIHAETLGLKLVLFPFLCGFFLFLYLPLRFPFLLEEHHLQPAQGRKMRILAELAVGTLIGLCPAFF